MQAERHEASNESTITDSRVQHRSYLFEDGEKIPYALFVPSSYVADSASPLLVSLHGLTRTYDWLMGYEGLLDFAEAENMLVVTPLGYVRDGWYGSREHEYARQSEQDVMNVLGLVRAEFNIDNNRIYLWGHSMGGAGTYHLAARHPDIWAAVGVAAPAPSVGPEQLDEFQKLPIIVLQGDQDRLVYPARKWVARMQELGMTHEYVEIAGGDHSEFISKTPATLKKLFDFVTRYTRQPTTEK